MAYSDFYKFRPRKKAPGVYFNDGHQMIWVQQDKDALKVDDNLIEAAIAARKVFFEIYNKALLLSN